MHTGFIVSGFLVGLVVGLTGVGGGSLMTPLLTLVLGVSPSVAVGTDLAFASITKSLGTVVHGSQRAVVWPVVRLMCAGSLPAALVAVVLIHELGDIQHGLNEFIRYSIAFSIVLTVIALIGKPRLMSWLQAHPEYRLHGRRRAGVALAVAALIGALVTVSSIGAGAVGATAIFMLYPELSAREVAASDIAYAVPLTGLSALGHVWLGTVNWSMLGVLLVGSLPGITLGSSLGRFLPDRIARGLLAATLTGVAVKMVF